MRLAKLMKLFNKRIITTSELSGILRSNDVIETEIVSLGESTLEGHGQYKVKTIDGAIHDVFTKNTKDVDDFFNFYKSRK